MSTACHVSHNATAKGVTPKSTKALSSLKTVSSLNTEDDSDSDDDPPGSLPLARTVTYTGPACKPVTISSDKHSHAGIFDLSSQEQTWTPKLEEIFRRHMNTALKRLAGSRKPSFTLSDPP